MDYLKIPLRHEAGAFDRTPPEDALRRYVALFFAARKYGSHPALDFGMDLDDLSWIATEDYLRVLVDEFNRVHRGRLRLRIEGQERHGESTRVLLGLRHGSRTYRIPLGMGSLTGAGDGEHA